ncbi:hypothetical protein [Amycolatopsis sacchari]|uniref:hypothetical protein n=1 Tax=Amycolatopsis sacchari TaxID=115433 RepID=UPI003D754FDA
MNEGDDPMTILPWSHRLRSAGRLCLEVLPETLIAGATVGIGAAYYWPAAAFAAVPAAFAARATYRTVRDGRHYDTVRWLNAERRWQLQQQRNVAGQLEGNHRPLVVEGTVVEAGEHR